MADTENEDLRNRGQESGKEKHDSVEGTDALGV